MPFVRQLFFLILSLLAIVLSSCNSSKKQNSETKTSTFQVEIPIHDYASLEPLLQTEEDAIHIVNFWAMWCAPCVKELPYLQEYANQNPEVDLLLISMDFPKDIDTKLKPFLKQQNITSKVVLLDDPDANTWIDKIYPDWSGAIPFTIIFNKDKRVYIENTFEDLAELEKEIRRFKKLR